MVDIYAINKSIKQLCVDVSEENTVSINWQKLSEEEVFREVAVCVIGSQMVFEQSVAIADKLKKYGLLKKVQKGVPDNFCTSVVDLLSEPIILQTQKGKSQFKPRFKNRIAKLLTDTANSIYENKHTFKGLLKTAGAPLEARKLLVGHVSGFGPKQASLFLRRVGYCNYLAVLDTHILDYMRMAFDLEIKSSALASLKIYESIESKFVTLAKSFGYSVGCVDLAMWVTMRVAKREYAI